MSSPKRIFIVGNSGAGKGMLAEALAEKLGYKFINADVLACAVHVGRTMLDVLGKEGEQRYLNCLTDILSHQTTQDNIVVTTDESIVSDEKARELLASEFTVYLKVSLPVQLERIADGDYRPLLPVSDFSAFLDAFRNEHDALYEQVARFSLNSDDGAIDDHVQQVIEAF